MKNLYILWAVLVFSCCGISSRAQLTEGLPVRISSFNISNNNKEVKLQWTVACGIPMAYFEIQRSVDGKDFKTIYRFNADRVRCQQPFDYLDNTAASENYYRIRVGDADGNFTHERIQFISTRLNHAISVTVGSLLRGNQLTLGFIAEKPTDLNLRLVSMNGRELQKTKFSIASGYNSSTWQIPSLPSGIYFIGYANSDLSVHGLTRFQIVQ